MLYRAIIERRPPSNVVDLPSPEIQVTPGRVASGEWVFVEAESRDGAMERINAIIEALIPGSAPGYDVICAHLASAPELLQSFSEPRTPDDYRRLLQLDDGGRVYLHDPLPRGGWPPLPIFFCSPWHRVMFNTAMHTSRSTKDHE